MSQSKCSHCGRIREMYAELDGGLVSHGICPECTLKFYEGDSTDNDVLESLREEIGKYGEWHGCWPYTDERPDITARVKIIKKRLAREGNSVGERKG